jgi:hypothetical protein
VKRGGGGSFRQGRQLVDGLWTARPKDAGDGETVQFRKLARPPKSRLRPPGASTKGRYGVVIRWRFRFAYKHLIYHS